MCQYCCWWLIKNLSIVYIKLVKKLSNSRFRCKTGRVPCSAFSFITEILLQVAVKALYFYILYFCILYFYIYIYVFIFLYILYFIFLTFASPCLENVMSFLNGVFVHYISLNCCSVLNSLQYTTRFLFDSAMEFLFDCIFSDLRFFSWHS